MKIDFNAECQKQLKFHFVGIGGISMSGLAAILHSRGYIVSGSDIVENEQTKMLRNMGIAVFVPHNRYNVKGKDIIIVNAAIAKLNPELLEARKLGLEIIERETFLADIERNFKTRIAVAGTHGKSTTTAMIYAILEEDSLDPTVHNGAVMYISSGNHANFVLGGTDIFLTEACEFKRSLLKLQPTIAVVTNVDADHMDCYQDINDIKATFSKFAASADVLIKNPDCINSAELEGRVKTLNFTEDIDIKLQIPGEHNKSNARAAAAVTRELGIDNNTIKKALFKFKGIERRFQKIKKIGGCDLIADYAHHPAEIKTTIQTAQSLYRKFLIIFQPHTYTRTLALWRDFVDVLGGCDCALFKTYAAREKAVPGGTAGDLAAALGCQYINSASCLKKFIKISATKYDAIILTGAGDMVYLAK